MAQVDTASEASYTRFLRLVENRVCCWDKWAGEKPGLMCEKRDRNGPHRVPLILLIRRDSRLQSLLILSKEQGLDMSTEDQGKMTHNLIHVYLLMH